MKAVHAACGVLIRKGRVYLRQRPEEGLLAGLWECPSTPFSGEPVSEGRFQEFWGGEVAEVGSQGMESVGSVRHVFSHRKLTLAVYCVADSGAEPEGGRWVSLADPGSEVALSRLTQKVLESLD